MSGIGGVIAEIGSFEKNLKFYEPITNPRIFFGVSPGFPKILAAISCKIVLILDFENSKSLHYIIFRILDFGNSKKNNLDFLKSEEEKKNHFLKISFVLTFDTNDGVQNS